MSQLRNYFAQPKSGVSGQLSVLALALAGAAFFSAAVTTPAQAGFEWVPPVKQAVAPAQNDPTLLPEMPALPRDSVEAIDMGAPLPASSAMAAPASPLLQPAPQIPAPLFAPERTAISAAVDASPDSGAPQFSPRLSAQNRAATVSPAVMPVETAVASAPAYAPASAYEQAVGFGSDIPLALAMRQIVPGQYAYVFSAGVDQGARIDWNGGKPWNEVLADAVRPHGLDIAVTDQTVRVFPQGQNPAPQTAHHGMTGHGQAAPMLSGVAETNEARLREVYVRRNSSSAPVVTERKPGEEAVTTQNTPVVLTADSVKKPKGQSGFWSHFGLNSSETTTIRNEDKIISQQGAVPAAPQASPQRSAPVAYQGDGAPQLIASMHDSQVYESEINAPLSLTTIPAERVSQAGNPYMMDFWSAEQGASLRDVLQNWSRNAGVELRWTAASDYQLPAPVRLQGSYTDALSQVLSAYDETGPRPLGRLHPNLPAGPSVLIIEASNS